MADRKGPKIPKPPEGAGRTGAAFWRQVLERLEMAPDEVELLREISRTMGQIERLDRVIRKSPPVVEGSQGPKTHPAIVEARQQRITLSRLLASLRLPDGWDEEQAPAEEPPRGQRRGGARGVYAIQGGRAS